MPFYSGDSDDDEIESVPIERVGIPVALRPAGQNGVRTGRTEATGVFPAVGRTLVDTTSTMVTGAVASAERFGRTFVQNYLVSPAPSDRATSGRSHLVILR